MAKLNGASALPAEAQNFLSTYKKMLGEMPELQAVRPGQYAACHHPLT